jgi:hypothetical protein
MKFGEKLGEKGGVLNRERKHPKTSPLFWDTNISPSNLALAPVAGFFTRPEESPTTLVNGFKDPNRKKPSTHGVREHRGEDGVHQDEASPNGERSPLPSEELQVTLGDKRVKVREAKLMGGGR